MMNAVVDMGVDKLARADEIAQALGVFFVGTRVPVIVVRLSGTIVAANDAAIGQYGYTRDELLEMRVHDLQGTTRPIDADLARAMIDDPAPLDRRAHRRKDGSVLWVVPTTSPIDVCGERLVVSVLKDVSAVVGAEAKARRDEERAEVMWRAAVEGLGAGVALLDEGDRVLRANSAMAALCETTAPAMVGRRCVDVLPGCIGATRCGHELARAEGRNVVDEIEIANQPLRIEIAPLQANGAGIATIYIARDLREERAIRSQLVSTDRLATIGRLCAGVAHEVNNPAGFVTLALQLLKDHLTTGGWTRADTISLLDESFEAMKQINQIMRDVTGFTRERARAVTDLTAVANSAIRLAAQELKCGVRVERQYDEDVIAHVRGARVAQVALNLIVNAAQALRREPRGCEAEPPVAGAPRTDDAITVRVFRSGEHACIEVADTGPGIPDDVATRIFEPFFTTREEHGGSGLGLWLSRSIAEEEGGTLSFENRREGGARFTVALPLMAPPPTRPSAPTGDRRS